MPLDRQPTLAGPTLRVRPLVPRDFEALYAVARDPGIWEQHPDRERWRRDVFEGYFADALASGGAVVVLTRDGELIGASRYDGLDQEARRVEIGWTFLARAHWGGPANRELKDLMLDHAFAAVDVVVFRVGADNRRSRRAVEKLGARLVRVEPDPRFGDYAVYELRAEDRTPPRPRSRTVRLRELLLGVEGLALLRHLYDGDDATADARVAEVRRILDDPASGAGEPTAEASPRDGYAAWAPGYDDPDNIVIALEEPAVWARLEDVAPGRALDAACGTGRHARRLVDLGHDVVGVDLTPEMLERARERVPEATFAEGDLHALPAPDAAFDLVVCGLALAHLPDLRAAVAELARVLRPGGRLVASVLHPFQAHLGWHAPFRDAAGARGFVREHPHAHADYLDAFAAAGLALCGCAEPVMTAAHAPSKRRAYAAVPEATVQAYAGLPAVLVWDVERR